jgi:uncharacterized protein involved in outer membrane biogenesis
MAPVRVGRRAGGPEAMKILYGVLAFIALLVVAAFVVPSFMDWNSYKPEISERIEALTGRQLFIDGDIEISLLPSPKLRIADVRLSNLPGAAAADMARLRALELQLALGPLLSGEIQVVSLKLIDPVIELEQLADGRKNWLFTPPPAVDGGTGGGDGGGTGGDGGGTGGDGAGGDGSTAIRADSVSIRNGTLVYRDSASGTVEYIQHLNGSLSAKSLEEGPFRGDGSLEVRGVAVTFQLASGNKRDGGHFPVSLKAELGDGLAQIGFEGRISALESGGAGSGTLRASGGDLAALLQALGLAGPHPLAAGKFSVKSSAAFSTASIALDELQIRLGDTQATGAIAYSFAAPAHVDAALTINRFDLDKLTAGEIAADGAAPTTGAAATGTDGAPGAPGAPDAPDSGYMAMLPGDLSASIDLEVQTLRYLGGVMHQAHAVLSLDDGVITVQQASALLPGGSNIALFGQLSPGGGGPRFEGQIEIESDDVRAAISWLDLFDTADIPTDRLRRFSFATAISADETGGELSSLDLRIDASRLVGKASFTLGARPTINADLHLDQLNADAYLAATETATGTATGTTENAGDATKTSGESGGAAAAADASGAPASNADLAFLDTLDAVLKLTAERLSYGGAVLSGITLEGRLKDNILTLRRLDVADLSGAKLALNGEIRGLSGAPEVNLQFDARSETILGLMRVAGIDPTFRADSLGAISFTGTLSGGREAINLNARLETRPATLSLVGSIRTPFEDAALNMGLEMRAGDMAELLRAAGLVPPKLARRLGALEIDGGLDGGLDALTMSLSARSGGNHLQLAGTLADFSGPARYNFTFDFSNPSFSTLAELLTGAPYEGEEVGAVRIKGRLAGAGNAATLTDLDLALGETRVRGTADFDLTGAVPVVRARLTAGLLDAGLFIGGAQAAADAGGDGESGGGGASSGAAPQDHKAQTRTAQKQQKQWSREPFDLSPLAEIEADIEILADAILAGGYRFDQAELKLRVGGGALEIDSLRGRIFGGLLEAQGQVTDSQPPQVHLAFQLDGMDIAEALRQAANITAATGRASVDGRFTTEGNSEYELVRALQGNATLSARDGTVEGIDLRILSDRLGALNDPGDFLKLADAGLSGGATRLDSLDGTIRVTNGLATTNDLQILADGGRGSVRGTVDLPSWRLDLTALFTLTDHPQAPPVGVHLTGPVDRPARELLTADMQTYLIAKIAKSTIGRVILPKLRKGAKAEPGSIEDTLLRGIFGDPDDDAPASLPSPPAESSAPALAPQRGGGEAPAGEQNASTLAPQQSDSTARRALEPAPAPEPASTPERAKDDPLSPQDILKGVLDILGN